MSEDTTVESALGSLPEEMIDPMTGEIIDQKRLAEQLLTQAKEQNIDLVGPDGLLNGLTKNVLETALDAEMSEHLGYDKHEAVGRNGANSRNSLVIGDNVNSSGHRPLRASRRDWRPRFRHGLRRVD